MGRCSLRHQGAVGGIVVALFFADGLRGSNYVTTREAILQAMNGDALEIREKLQLHKLLCKGRAPDEDVQLHTKWRCAALQLCFD